MAKTLLLISRLLCERREGSEILPDSFKIRFRNPVELYASSEPGRTVGDFALCPRLGFSDPDPDFYFGTLRQWDCHFNVTAADAEVADNTRLLQAPLFVTNRSAAF
jgi:hypothetical protein